MSPCIMTSQTSKFLSDASVDLGVAQIGSLQLHMAISAVCVVRCGDRCAMVVVVASRTRLHAMSDVETYYLVDYSPQIPRYFIEALIPLEISYCSISI